MTADVVAGLVVETTFLACALGAFWASRPGRPTTEQQVANAEDYLTQRDLPCEPELVAVTTRLQTATNRAGLRAMAVALTVAAVIGPVVAVISPPRWLDAVAVPLFFLLALVVFAVIHARVMRHNAPRAGGPHVAHGARPRLTDYVTPLAVAWPAIIVVVCGVAAADFALHPPADAGASPAVVVIGLAAGTLTEAGTLALAFWLAARPQPASTPDELALRNELTSDVLSRLLLFPGVAVTLMAGSDMSGTFVLVGAALWIVYLTSWSPRQRVRRRLFAARPRPPTPLAGS